MNKNNEKPASETIKSADTPPVKIDYEIRDQDRGQKKNR